MRSRLKRTLFGLYNLVRLHPVLAPVANSALMKRFRRTTIADPFALAVPSPPGESSPVRWSFDATPSASAALVAIYRRGNAHYLARLLASARSPLAMSLWALDEPIPELEKFTIGTGPEAKFPLLNALLAHLDGDPEFVIVADDDVTIERGSLALLMDIARKARFDLCQPAHVLSSYSSYATTLRRMGSIARMTNFIEIGPLFVLARRAREWLTPFAAEVKMGWGLEYDWMRASERGLRLGVIDAVRMRHHVRPGATYDDSSESSRIAQLVAEHGGASLHELQRTLATWRRGRARPPWVTSLSEPASS